MVKLFNCPNARITSFYDIVLCNVSASSLIYIASFMIFSERSMGKIIIALVPIDIYDAISIYICLYLSTPLPQTSGPRDQHGNYWANALLKIISYFVLIVFFNTDNHIFMNKQNFWEKYKIQFSMGINILIFNLI